MRPTIFVFGSNLAGVHGAGAAKYALDYWGAEWGVGEGIQGQSYGIPTKDWNIQSLTEEEVRHNIGTFCVFASDNRHVDFLLTPVGCGLAGFNKKFIWSCFKVHSLPSNVYLTSTWITD